MKSQLFGLLCAVVLVTSACGKSDVSSSGPTSAVPAAPLAQAQEAAVAEEDNALDELDPFAPDIKEQLKAMDEAYEQATGESAFLPSLPHFFGTGCRRENCPIWARVEKSQQKMYLYVNRGLVGVYDTSTGVPGRDTPNFDKHPDGRIYDRYTSTKFPGGDYNGLGNMPYAVFISGGFAIHGTGKGNWKRLGRVASHGCIRIHPDNAFIFNRLVRQYGAANTWITVE